MLFKSHYIFTFFYKHYWCVEKNLHLLILHRHTLPSRAVSQTKARASGHLFHSWTWKVSAALGSVSVKTNKGTSAELLKPISSFSSSQVFNQGNHASWIFRLTVDIMGSMIAATSICFSSSRGMPISMAAAARSRTLEAEWTTSGMTSFAHRSTPSPIWDGACSSIL